MTEEESRLNGLLEASATHAVLLGRRYPPSAAPAAAGSYFGGTPRLPPGMAWPTATGGRMLHFLAQIDLAELPALPDGVPLPATGTLFFFATVADDTIDRRVAASWAAVRYAPGGGSAWPMRAPPPALGPLHDGEGGIMLGWLYEGDPLGSDEPCTYPYWPMTLHAIRSYPDDHASVAPFSEEARRYRSLYEAAQADAFAAALGPPATYALPSWWSEDNRHRFDPAPLRLPGETEVWSPDESWPFGWAHLRVVAARMLHALDGARHRLERAVSRGQLDAAAASVALAAQAAAREGAEAWYLRARRGGIAMAVPAADRAAFRAWLQAIALPPGAAETSVEAALRALDVSSINGWTATALEQGTDACLGYAAPPGQAPAWLPAHLLAVMAPAYAPFDRDIYGGPRLTCHQLLGAPRSIQGAAEALAPTHRLLAQFDYDPRLLFRFGDVGAVQFWITPADLAAGRFEACVATLEGF